MKTKQSIVYGLLAVILALAFVACPAAAQQINSATELKAYLDKQPANSPDKPIKVAMKVNDLMIKDIVKVLNDANKYVSLDLSGSPLTEIPRRAFQNCETLVGITIPNSVTDIGSGAFYHCRNLTSVTFQSANVIMFRGVGSSFLGDLRDKYLAGGIGTYTTTAPVGWGDSIWTKQ
jgi:hypothetical protein